MEFETALLFKSTPPHTEEHKLLKLLEQLHHSEPSSYLSLLSRLKSSFEGLHR